MSASVSFAALVSAIEAMTEHGEKHKATCNECGASCVHETPVATERFRSFLERYTPGESEAPRRSKMYRLRSNILHGSLLMQLDQERAMGWTPVWLNELGLHTDLWFLTKKALRNSLAESITTPPASSSPTPPAAAPASPPPRG